MNHHLITTVRVKWTLFFSIVLSYLCLFVQDIIVLYFCCVCLRLVCPMLPVSLYCPFVNVYSLIMSISDVDFLHLSYQAKFKRKKNFIINIFVDKVLKLNFFGGVFCIDV